MSELKEYLQHINQLADRNKDTVVSLIKNELAKSGYEIAEINSQKPWGAYFRIVSGQAETFIDEFFPGLTIDEARLGIDNAELSPKILLVSPAQQLSWQYHDFRAERWAYLTEGRYYKSMTDELGGAITAHPGGVVQFQRQERHRLSAANESDYTLVAEIWQHSDARRPSDEDDIVRIADDYQR